jgi:hypothetical protein
LIIMVLIGALIMAALTGTIAIQHANTVDRANAEAQYVAEGGADAVMSQLASFMSDGYLSAIELGQITAPTVSGWTYDAITATKIGGTVIRTITDGDYAGLVSYNQQIDLRVQARDPANNRGDVIITANAQAIPIFQFGVFYDSDLEIHPGANMTFEGWVHSNANIFLSANSLNFQSLITTPDSLIWQRKSNNERLNGVDIDDAGGTAVNLTFDQRSTTYEQFVTNSQDDFDGRVRTIAHGVAPLRLPLPLGVPPHTLIEPRVAGDNLQVKDVKFAWKADLVLRIDVGAQTMRHNQTGHFCNNGGTSGTAPTNGSGNVNAMWQRDSSGFNTLPNSADCKSIFKWNPTTSSASSPTLAPTRFRDGREDVQVTALDIDIAALRTWSNASWANRRVRILYVEFYNVPSGVYPAVRIINGSRLPGTDVTPTPAADYGLSIVTHAPMYVKGDFNYVGNATNNWKPAALVADAIIFQSPSWDDGPNASDNGGTYGATAHTYKAAGGYATGTGYDGNTMYVYAAVAAGHSATICDWQTPGCPGVYATNYGGGLENFPRFLENWGGKTLHYRGSLVSLYTSQQAAIRGWGASPQYYSPPARDWRFDLRFNSPDNLPPGTPLVGSVMQLAYRPVY